MGIVYEDKLDLSKMNVSDGAVVKPTSWTELARYQVKVGEFRAWGYTEPVSATQVIMGSIKALIQDSTPAAIDDNARIRLVVSDAGETKKIEVFRGKYADLKNGVNLPLKAPPWVKPFSYLIIEAQLPDGATSFTFSKANSDIQVSTTVSK